MAGEDILVFQLATQGDSKCDECGRVHSKRIGRTANAKDFDPSAIDLALQAHVRHRHTKYDAPMADGVDRHDAPTQVREAIDAVLAQWREKA